MPSAPKICKQILSALEDSIIPALHRQGVAVGCVEPPFHFPAGIEARLISASLPRADADGPSYPIQCHWTKAKLHSSFHPYFGFLYEGAADEHTLVNAAQASKNQISKGIYGLRWQSPSTLLFPAGTPRKNGGAGAWDGPDPHPSSIGILWLYIAPTGIFIHTRIENQNQPAEISHSLLINDDSVLDLSRLFIRESQAATSENQQIAQAILLALMLRLQHHLQTESPKLANTSRPQPSVPNLPSSDGQQHDACQEALIFIQLHLHEKLTLPLIAQQVGFSPAHLNRLFQQTYGVTIMRYVRQHRVAAAQRILDTERENIAEVAVLVGFKNSGAFCDVFRQETGLTPGQFRRQARRGSVPSTHDDSKT